LHVLLLFKFTVMCMLLHINTNKYMTIDTNRYMDTTCFCSSSCTLRLMLIIINLNMYTNIYMIIYIFVYCVY
jgi:hypothetical protein